MESSAARAEASTHVAETCAIHPGIALSRHHDPMGPGDLYCGACRSEAASANPLVARSIDHLGV